MVGACSANGALDRVPRSREKTMSPPVRRRCAFCLQPTDVPNPACALHPTSGVGFKRVLFHVDLEGTLTVEECAIAIHRLARTLLDDADVRRVHGPGIATAYTVAP
jgi:hypothetical protein